MFVTQAEGDHELSIYDMGQNRIVQTFRPPEAEAITDPTWGPDGRIAFVGYGGGISDLFVLDPTNGSVQRLTDDRNSELHPAWSPDGVDCLLDDRDPATDSIGGPTPDAPAITIGTREVSPPQHREAKQTNPRGAEGNRASSARIGRSSRLYRSLTAQCVVTLRASQAYCPRRHSPWHAEAVG